MKTILNITTRSQKLAAITVARTQIKNTIVGFEGSHASLNKALQIKAPRATTLLARVIATSSTDRQISSTKLRFLKQMYPAAPTPLFQGLTEEQNTIVLRATASACLYNKVRDELINCLASDCFNVQEVKGHFDTLDGLTKHLQNGEQLQQLLKTQKMGKTTFFRAEKPSDIKCEIGSDSSYSESESGAESRYGQEHDSESARLHIPDSVLKKKVSQFALEADALAKEIENLLLDDDDPEQFSNLDSGEDRRVTSFTPIKAESLEELIAALSPMTDDGIVGPSSRASLTPPVDGARSPFDLRPESPQTATDVSGAAPYKDAVQELHALVDEFTVVQSSIDSSEHETSRATPPHQLPNVAEKNRLAGPEFEKLASAYQRFCAANPGVARARATFNVLNNEWDFEKADRISLKKRLGDCLSAGRDRRTTIRARLKAFLHKPEKPSVDARESAIIMRDAKQLKNARQAAKEIRMANRDLKIWLTSSSFNVTKVRNALAIREHHLEVIERGRSAVENRSKVSAVDPSPEEPIARLATFAPVIARDTGSLLPQSVMKTTGRGTAPPAVPGPTPTATDSIRRSTSSRIIPTRRDEDVSLKREDRAAIEDLKMEIQRKMDDSDMDPELREALKETQLILDPVNPIQPSLLNTVASRATAVGQAEPLQSIDGINKVNDGGIDGELAQSLRETELIHDSVSAAPLPPSAEFLPRASADRQPELLQTDSGRQREFLRVRSASLPPDAINRAPQAPLSPAEIALRAAENEIAELLAILDGEKGSSF